MKLTDKQFQLLVKAEEQGDVRQGYGDVNVRSRLCRMDLLDAEYRLTAMGRIVLRKARAT